MTKEELMMSKDIIEIVNFKNKNKDSNLSYKKDMFYRKYSTYYKHPQIKTKINFYKNTLNGKKVTVIKKENMNLKKLNKVINIYKSDLDLYNKIDKITTIFKDSNELWLSYYDLIIPLIDEKIIKDLNNVFMFLKKNSEIIDFVRYYSDNAKKYSNYEYAKFIIDSYLDNGLDMEFQEFLYNYGIDNKSFDYCVETICEFDLDLYNEYIKKNKIYESNDRYNNKKIINDLIIDIKNNTEKGKCNLSISEFFRRVPFKNSKDFSKTLLNFIKNNMPFYYQIMSDSLHINRLYKREVTKEMDIDELFKSCTIINGYNVTKEDKLKILTYMQENNYPMIKIVFNDLLGKYVNQELILTEIKDIKKRKILIP